MLAEYERTIVQHYRDALRAVRREIADVYARFGDDVSYAEMQKYKRLASLEQAIVKELQRLGVQARSAIRAGIKDVYSASYYHSAFTFETTLQTKFGFGALDPAKIEAAVFNPLDRIKWSERLSGHITVLNRRIQSAITQGLIQGYGLARTARSVREAIERNAYESLRIIRTESQRAQSAARLAAIEKVEAASSELGFSVYRVWLATLDQRTRESHRQLDGQRADADGFFYFGDGGRTQAPGMSGIAEEDIHCRCTVITEFEGIPQQMRRDNEAKVNIPYTTYEQWYENRIKK